MNKKIPQAIAIAAGVLLTGIGGSATINCIQQVLPWTACAIPTAITLAGMILIIVGFYS